MSCVYKCCEFLASFTQWLAKVLKWFKMRHSLMIRINCTLSWPEVTTSWFEAFGLFWDGMHRGGASLWALSIKVFVKSDRLLNWFCSMKPLLYHFYAIVHYIQLQAISSLLAPFDKKMLVLISWLELRMSQY